MEYSKEKKNYFQDYHLEQFEWSIKIKIIFMEENINLLSDLVKYHPREFLKLPNFGKKSLKEIETFLSSMNLSLGTSLEGIKVLSAYDENNRIIKFSENPTNETNSHSEVLQRTFQDYDLSQFELSVRTRNVLEKEDINLLSELVSYNKYELLRMPNFGKWSLKEIEEFLSNLNLHLGMVLDDEDILSAYDENNRIIMFSENPTNETNSYSEAIQRTFQDYDLSQFEWSARTSNVFEAENINLLSKLVSYNRHELLRLSNFGRNSLKEIETFLSSMNLALGMFLNEIEILSAFDENNEMLLYKGSTEEKNYSDAPKSIIKNFEYFLNKLEDDRSIDILKKRSGLFLNRSITLEEIAKEYSMTRERVRQIEKKAIDKLQKIFLGWNINNYWAKLLNSKFLNLTHPLRLETLKSYIEFEDITEETISVFKYICSKLKPRFFVNNNFGFNYVCRVETEVIDKLINETHTKLSLSEGDTIEVIRNKIKNLFYDEVDELFEYVIEHTLKNSFISKNENDEDYLISYSKRSSVKSAVVEMFHLNKKPLSNNQIKSIIETKYPEFEIRNFVNQLNELSKEFKIHQFSHGTWGKLEYLDLDENEILEVISCINTFIENLDKDQFHAREICEQYIKDLNVSEKFNNYFIISAIIRERLDLQYLGRCVFSTSKNKNIERLKIHDVVVDVLNKFKKPLHATKLMEEVKKIRSINYDYQFQPKPPIKLFGNNIFGLDHWSMNEFVKEDMRVERDFLTEDQIEILKKMLTEGKSIEKVSQEINCPRHTVRVWAKRLSIKT